MKRSLKLFLISCLLLLLLPVHLIKQDHAHTHVHTVEALSPGDAYGTCPQCGQPMYIADLTAGCESAGEVYYWCQNTECSNYTVMYNGSIPALGHDWTDSYASASVAATCISEGSQPQVCSRCGASRTQTIPALGHNYRSSVLEEATCTQAGTTAHTCSRCGDSYTETVKALGHNYRSKITVKATCEEEGTETYTCSRCGDSYTRTIQALGHDYEVEETEATCTEDGLRRSVCRTCGEETEETVPALGHDLGDYTVIREAYCEKEGMKQALCKRCGETVEEIIPAKGHRFPEEWTVEKEAGFFAEGLLKKECPDCDAVLTETIPRKNILPIILGGLGLLALMGGGLYVYLRKKRGERAVREAAEEPAEYPSPDIGSKSVLLCEVNEELIETLKERRYLEVSVCTYEELLDSLQEEPDLLVISALEEERYQEILSRKKESFPETNTGLLLKEELADLRRKELDQMVKEKEILNYAVYGRDTHDAVARLILPIIKPDLSSDSTLGNIGMAADILGIPGISTLIELYTTGREIKSTLEEGDLGVSGTALIISDIASILGLDTLASVTGLVDDVETIKAALDKEAGAYEKAEGQSAAKDVVEVVSDLISKE